MRRIRVVFALAALALAVPAALLVQRALESVEAERAVRQRALAERVFDELERRLSDFLRSEEERPVDHYAFTHPEASVGGGTTRVRSPLSAPPGPERAFVVGHFQIDPDGSFHTPLRPRPGEPAGDFRATPALEARIQRIERAARAGVLRGDGDEGAAEDLASTRAPGTTWPAAREEEVADAAREKAPAPSAGSGLADAPAESSYEAFRAFNVGAELRRQRSPKVLEQEPLEAKGERASAQAADEIAERDAADAATAAPEPASPRAAREGYGRIGGAGTGSPPPEGPPAAIRALRVAPEPPAPPPAPVRVVVDPLLGRSVDGGGTLLLVRTVLEGDRGRRQGLVVDRAGLEAWLREGVPALARLPGARLDFGESETPAAGYRHRFGEPFHALTATLVLPPLEGGGGARSVAVLSALLVLAGGLGLFALYRMVAVTVGFAERRSSFVSAVSHELKTPLTAIRMVAEMLRDGLVPSEAKRREYYATLTAESERLSRLIQNVLEFSKLERGGREAALVVGPLAPVVEEAVGVLRPHAERSGFELVVSVPESLPAVRFDRDALLQVLFNLVDNAEKYARDARDRRIHIEARDEGGRVVLAVRDAGPGVPEAQLGRIFEPFYRGEDELTRTAQGAGIGLALVRGLTERMGATLRAHNRAGGGLEVAIGLEPA